MSRHAPPRRAQQEEQDMDEDEVYDEDGGEDYGFEDEMEGEAGEDGDGFDGDDQEEGEEDDITYHVKIKGDANRKKHVFGGTFGRGSLLVWSADLVQLRSDSLFIPEAKKLLYEGHNYFMTLKRRKKELSEADFRGEALRMSRGYRALLRAQTSWFRDRVKTSKDAFGEYLPYQVSEEYRHRYPSYRISEILWHLCEIFYVSSAAIITQMMVDWLQLHFSDEATQKLTLEIESETFGSDDNSFWSSLIKLVTKGRIKEAAKLLAVYNKGRKSTGASDAFHITEILLKNMPRIYPGYSVAGFVNTWKQWQQDCRNLWETHAQVKANPNLSLLMGILCGDEELLNANTNTWFELLMTYILFVDPTTKRSDYRFLAEKCIAKKQEGEELSPLDSVLRAFICLEPVQGIQEASEYLGYWFSSHLADLLNNFIPDFAQPTQQKALYGGADFRETMILEFVEDISTHPGTWEVAVDYLATCPVYGPAFIRELIARQPVESETKVFKLLRVCDKHGLSDEAKVIKQTFGTKMMKEGRPGPAIHWYMLAKDSGRLAQLANSLLDNFLVTGQMDDIESVWDNLGNQYIFSDKLEFLAKYRDYQIKLREGKLEEGIKLVISLISAHLAPKKFWPTLLRSLAPFLQPSEQGKWIGVEETYALMECLEEVSLSHQKQDYIQAQANFSQSDLDSIRLSLSQNLARAILVHQD